MKCIENIIGITQSNCGCITNGLTQSQIDDMGKSASGLFLSEDLEGGINIQEVKTFDHCGEYFSLAKKAIEAAKKRFEDDIQVAMLEKYQTNKPNYIGDLGRLQFVASLPANTNVQFLRVSPKDNVSASMKIHGVRLVVDSDITTNIRLIAVEDGLTYGEELFNIEVNTQANRYINADIPVGIEVPFYKNGRKMHYFFTWERVDGANPKDNGVSCGCAGGDPFDEYVEISGGEAFDYDQLGGEKQPFSRGLVVLSEMYCNVGDFVCKEYDAKNNIAIVSSWANLYKAGELLIENVMSSGEISRFTTMNREYLWGKRNHFRKEYKERMEFLTEAIDARNSDCFICNENNAKMFVGNIFGGKD